MFQYDACAAVYKALDNKDIAISVFNDEYAKSVDDITALFEKAKEYV
jgi:methylaspartate ammonia-lyase